MLKALSALLRTTASDYPFCVLSVLLRNTASDYPFGIFKLICSLHLATRYCSCEDYTNSILRNINGQGFYQSWLWVTRRVSYKKNGGAYPSRSSAISQ